MESKTLQILYVNESFDEAMSAEYPTHRKFLSKSFSDFLEGNDGWTISEMIQHEISVVIKGRAEEDLDKYRKLPPLKYGLPANTDADRGFVFVIFQKYQEKLHGSGQFDTDDVVLSAVGQLNTPIWRRRRKQEGYDSVFVDETHLFNMNELHVFHFLTKVEGPYPIVYSVDRSQALGDRAWADNTIADAITPNGEQFRQTDKTIVKAIFRSSPDIINLAFSVTSSGATLFTNFDDPLQMAASAFTAEEERNSMPPVYLSCPNDEAMIEAAFERADKMVDEMGVSKGEILIVSFDEEIFKELRAFSEQKNKPVEVIHRRGDIEVKDRAKEAGRFVLGHVDYVGGLEFAGAMLIGVDKGRVPPTRGGDHNESQNFLSYASHNRLYVAITRAKYRIEILGVEARGPSTLLQSALTAGVLDSQRF